MNVISSLNNIVNTSILHSFPTRRSSDLYFSNFCYNKENGDDNMFGNTFDNVIRIVLTTFIFSAAIMPVMKRIDRKSTRLNSSHVSISYAVFCLKRKKIDRNSEMLKIDMR